MTAQQSAHARDGTVRDLAALTDDLTVGSDKNYLVHAAQYRGSRPKPDLPIG